MDNEEVREYLKRLTLELRRVRSRLQQVEESAAEPIAIVAMSCLYPGARSPEELWDVLQSGGERSSEFPSDRGWDIDQLYDPDPGAAGKFYAKRGGFIADVSDFDAGFFGISPREALATDPQQRLLLELAWQALERAGLDAESMQGSSTGVFIGLSQTGYGAGAELRTPELEGFGITGTALGVASGRIAYYLGLRGPAVTVDTACSSSLVALHLACQALRQRECDLALTGGAAVIASPQPFITFSRQRGLAPDGRCKSFSAQADGTGWAEGAGMLVLERLSDAQRSGHPILAVVRGSAVNQDGRSQGLTAPSGPAQVQVIRRALASAQLTPAEVDAVEAHGTGTVLGDPIEAQALLEAYGAGRSPERPLWLGSLKSNIGHAQAAAGVGGVIKLVLALQHGLLPKTLHAQQPTPHVDWSAKTVRLLHEAVAWEGADTPRRAGVSAFGLSGTNAHVIVEEAPALVASEPAALSAAESASEPAALSAAGIAREPAALSASGPTPLPFVLTAKSFAALRAQAGNLKAHIEQHEPALLDVAHSLATSRTAFDTRAVLVAHEREELFAALERLANEGAGERDAAGAVAASRLALLFTGQGSQRAGMGRSLYASQPVFRAALDAAFAEFAALLARPLQQVMFAEPGSDAASWLDRTEYGQPALFALELSLYRLLESWGVRAKYLLGHSLGEIVAAHVAGMLTLTDACRLVSARARLMQALPQGGAMAALEASEAEVLAWFAQGVSGVSLAAVNGPRSLVVSGDEAGVSALQRAFADQGRKVRRLQVSHAFHSAHMEPMLDAFEAVLKELSFRPAQLAIISSVTGQLADPELLCQPSYWLRQVREPVRFHAGLEALCAAGASGYMELGPDGSLSALVREGLEREASGTRVWPAMRKGRAEESCLLEALGGLYASGHDVDWRSYFAARGGRRVALPTYAFQRARYWLAPSAGAADLPALGLASSEHPLLAASALLAEGGGALFTGRLSLSTHAFLSEYALYEAACVPSSALVELVLSKARALGCELVQELRMEAPLLVPIRGGVQLQLMIGSEDAAGQRAVSLHARPDADEGEWKRHAFGRVAGHATQALAALPVWPPVGARALEVDEIYRGLAEAGLHYGERLGSLRCAYRRGSELFLELALPEGASTEASHYGLHPSLLEGVVQAVAWNEGTERARIPELWQGVTWFAGSARELRVCVSALPAGHGVAVSMWDGLGAPCGQIEALHTRPASEQEFRAQGAAGTLYQLEWVEAASGRPDHEQPGWSLLGASELWQSSAGLFNSYYADMAALRRALDAGEPAPAGVVFACTEEPEAELPRAAQRATEQVLALLQTWLADERLGASQLLVLTRGALAARAGDAVAGLAHAPVWGLLRSAQTEHPDRGLRLLDLAAGEQLDEGALGRALAAPIPQLALREGSLRAPALSEARAALHAPALSEASAALHASLDGCESGTVLITGGTGALGALLARHLVVQHGVRHLLLCSRSGGAEALVRELAQHGAAVRVVACDVADRDAVQALLETIEPEQPLKAVIHTAGVIDDGVLLAQSSERIARVFAAKVAGAWHLHELTRDLGLSAFVLFSSVSGVLGAAGQSNYAAANTFLDALAQQRRAAGLVATSLAWGAWSERSALSGQLSESDRARISRLGVEALSAQQGLALFDAALRHDAAQLVPVRLNVRALRAAEELPFVLRELVPRRRRTLGRSSLAARLSGLSEVERARTLLELVSSVAGAVLAADPLGIAPERPLSELGLDSLMALELRTQLGAAAGLRLPSTLLFDYPTPKALSGYLCAELLGAEAPIQSRTVAADSACEPVAIVSMSCRYPGQVSSPEALWELLVRGGDVVGEFPSDRGWDPALYDPDPEARGKSSASRGSFLYQAADFDAGFFGISPREALATDPQQRLLLETAWEAFERMGVVPAALHGSATGVFVGLNYHDYGPRDGSAGEELEGYLGIGVAGSVASGRISYTFGLQGPALTVDTACSSSLVALHLACQSLARGECDLALAGGVTLMATPAVFIEFSRQRALAPDGRCKPFSAQADGTGWGEGVGMLVLERLSDAQKNGHRVLALVRGSAINQDGRSQGLTAPNGVAQQQVIRQALAAAQLSPEDVDAVEAHGTGTTLGDPIEAQALLLTYGKERSAQAPVWLGSLKSNLGHTQAAAGVGGIMKLVLALEHELLPQSLHAEQPTSHVDWSLGSVRLLSQPLPWPRAQRPRRAAVSSFGMSGTNAHVILEEPPSTPPPDALPEGAQALPFFLSAKSEAALQAQAGQLRGWLLARPELRRVDVAHSLFAHRTAFELRAALVASDREELLSGLQTLADGGSAANLVVRRSKPAGKLVFVFPGQGSQWLGMAKQLLASSALFARELDACAAALAPFVSWSLRDVLLADDPATLERVDVVQPVLFAVMVSLAALWRSQGVEPAAVIGHSQGEIAAAYVAGALSLADAARVVALRARALTRLSGRGGMAALELPAEQVEQRLARFDGRLSIAAINSPHATVVSGDSEAIDVLLAELASAEILGRRINVDYASHCAQLEQIREPLLSALSDIAPRPSALPLYSTVHGGVVAGEQLDARYWYENGRNTVRFSDAVQALLADGHRQFVEVSPHPVLTQAVQTTADAERVPAGVVGTLRRDQGSLERFLLAKAELQALGGELDWGSCLAGGRAVALPTYPFQRQRYWLDRERAGAASDLASLGLTSADHPLFAASVLLAGEEGAVFTGCLSLAAHGWLSGHVLHGQSVLPATAILELALAAAQALGGNVVEELTMEAPLVLPERGALQLQLTVGALAQGGVRSLTLHARDEASGDGWTRCASGTLGAPAGESATLEAAHEAARELESWPPEGASSLELAGLYDALAAAGVVYGEAFRGLQSAYRRGDELFAEVSLPASVSGDANRYALHPALFDAALQARALVEAREQLADEREATMPFAWQGVSLHATGATTLRVRMQQPSSSQLTLVLADPSGELVGHVEALRVQAARAADGRAARPEGLHKDGLHKDGLHKDGLYRVDWTPVESGADMAPRWAWLGEDVGGLSQLPEALDRYADLEALRAALAAGAPAPELLVCACASDESDQIADAHTATHRLLALLQQWFGAEQAPAARLLIVTRGAVAASAQDRVSGLSHAPLWGLVRSVRSEHPDAGLRLLDLDDAAQAEDEQSALFRAALASSESELALRAAALLSPRLVRHVASSSATASSSAASAAHKPWSPHGTVLITGGTGALGAQVARHLVAQHGARRLVLCARSGQAPELQAELEAQGAAVRVVACDVSQREQVAALLASIPDAHPLTAVIHTAAQFDDGVFSAMSPARIDRMFGPKLDGAWHLHELTRDRALAAFIVFSSVAGVLGGPGQSSYAAANTFLDALAQRRRAEGLAASALCWGLWARGEHQLPRNRMGLVAMSPAQGLALLDAALAAPATQLVAAQFAPQVFTTPEQQLPLLRHLGRGRGRARLRRAAEAAAGSAWGARLGSLHASERERAVLSLIASAVSKVMGVSAASVEAERPLRELGLDSLMAVELRNHLAQELALRLPSTLLFDHPTPSALRRYLEAQLLGSDTKPKAVAARTGSVRAEPIALVAMSCRYPGGADSPEALWQLLAQGLHISEDFPHARGWDAELLYDPDPNATGKSIARKGSFLRGVAGFDAAFFGISPREAQATDPQQRLLLETSWEALERAGIDPSSLSGSSTGVFVGLAQNGYHALGHPPELEAYLANGSAASVASGRIAYAFGLQGPAVSVDTACSSSLVAMHLACQSLRQGECDLALAGGAAVMATPGVFVEFSRQRGLARDGRCKAFSDDADGTAFGEGVAVLVLERLSDALRHGHPVLALVRGSAINQDGKSQGLTAPSGPAQEQVIRQALANAQLAPRDVDALEAHGTGTTLGDPIEAQAILATYGADRAGERPLWLGSLKSNIGHTMAAAGVGGVIKMVLALQQELLPKTLHVAEPSKHVDWSAGAVSLLQQPTPWPRGERPRRAGISSFGISGTNAHLILEEAPAAQAPVARTSPDVPRPLPFVLSAKSEPSLRAQAERLRALLEAQPELQLEDVAYSLTATRAALPVRAVAVTTSRPQLLESLSRLATGEPCAALSLGRARERGQLAVLFTGQGSQRAEMGKRLYASDESFREALDRACAAFTAELGRPLQELLFAPGESEEARALEQTAYAQPALFALEVALYRALEQRGVRADYLIGHSVGEIAAAHVAGVMALGDACKLVAARGRLMQALPSGGAMVALEASEDELRSALAPFVGRADVAAVNGPRATVVSGDEQAVHALAQEFEARGRRARRLSVSHAFHSPRMEPMLEAFAQLVAELPLQPPALPIVSNVTGELATSEQLCNPAYWVEHVRRSVRFYPGIRALRAAGVTSYLELGPHGVLTALVREALSEEEQVGITVTSALRKERDEAQSWLLALGELHANGAAVALQSEPSTGRRVPLPTYAFQHEHFWPGLDVTRTGDLRALGLSSAEHPLLGASVRLAGREGALFTGRLSLSATSWLSEHVIHGATILPGTAFVELALAAAHRLGLSTLDELSLEAPLILPQQGGVQLQLAVAEPDQGGVRALSVHSRREDAGDDEAWVRHARGALVATRTPPAAGDDELRSWPPEAATPLDFSALYDQLALAGASFGELFRGLRAVYRRGEELFAELALPERAISEAARYGVHPALLDAALHTLFLRAPDAELRLPFAWQGVSLERTGASALRVRLTSAGPERVSLLLADETGTTIGRVEAVHARRASAAQLRSGEQREGLFRVDWVSVPAAAPAPRTWAVVGAACEGLPVCEQYADLSALSAAVASGAPVPEVVLFPCVAGDAPTDLPACARAEALRVLDAVRAFAADDRLAASRFVLLTQAAVAVGSEGARDLVHAPLWGLLRAAQAEHPDRNLMLLDVDALATPACATALAAGCATDEPQLAVRAGALLAPRLVRHTSAQEAGPELSAGIAAGTVLITGGTGALGGLLAEHLVVRHGVRQLLLCSRSGRADALAARLTELGASVRVAACDVSDRAQVAALLASISAEHPLTAVIHTAAVIADGALSAQGAASFEQVFAPKLDGAFHLHELTRACGLSAFVLFSSIAGVLGGPGQSNYAAANAFLDALAAQRRAEGLAASALAWGPWQQPSGLTSQLKRADLERMARVGLEPLSNAQALALFDAALPAANAPLVAARLDLRALAASPRAPSMLRGLSPARGPSAVRAAAAGSLKGRLAHLQGAERERALREAVLSAVSSAMGVQAGAVASDRPLSELGIDSLMAIELRNQLAARAGLRLPATLLFDHPTPAALCRFLDAQLFGGSDGSVRTTVAQTRTSSDPIAIVAMSCRYPGGAASPEALWQLLQSGGDAIGEFPSDRDWNLDALYDPDPDALGKTSVRLGGFLHDAAQFDPGFFGMAPREAVATDPQQRLLLETSWEALERAGIQASSLSGSATGVFVGIMYNDYAARFSMRSAGSLEGQIGVGSAPSVASGRIAYNLGLQGPAITVDTACSSSLVTLHLACQALRNGECDLALAGGATVMATPLTFVEFSRQRGMAADGRCKAFSADADGVGWSEGVGMLVLERLSDARRNGHPVLALLRGSAVNQDGKSQGLTAPNGPAQEQVIRQALANAELSPGDVDAVEGHGTGTTLGDPIELQALLATYGAAQRSAPLWLGSLKSNLGHTQAAAGVGGVIKMVLALQHELLPKTLNAELPSEHVDWSAGSIRLLQEATPWQRAPRPRRASVSSFGISGTNAHVIVEEAPLPSPFERELGAAPGGAEPHALPFLLSARTDAALHGQAQRLAEHLRAHPELALRDVAYALATTRSPFERRAALVAQERETLLRQLTQLGAADDADDAPGGLVVGSASESGEIAVAAARTGELALLFTGQGSQRAQMGAQLYAQQPAFRAALDDVFAAFEGAFTPALREVMFAPAGSEQAALLERTGYAQPALFALEVALYRLLASWGVRAHYLLGHSVGEIAAAHVAGVMSLRDACTLVAARAQLMQALPAGGAMAAIEATEAELAPSLEGAPDVALAAVNGPRSLVVSGAVAAVAALADGFAARGRRVRRLSVSHAFHSPLMEPMLAAFERVVRGLALHPAQLPIVSNLTGLVADPEVFCDPAYWVRQVREPVRFHAGVQTLMALGIAGYLELGPQAVLATSVKEALADIEPESAPGVWSVLDKQAEEGPALVRALSSLHAQLGGVDWRAFFAPLGARAVPLPTYAFQRARYWLSAGHDVDPSAIGLATLAHPLLGASLELARGDGVLFTGKLSRVAQPWLLEQRAFAHALLPSSVLVEWLLTAARRVGLTTIEELSVEAELFLPARGALQVQLSLDAPGADERRSFTLHARPEEGGQDAAWTRYASGALGSGAQADQASAEPLSTWPPLASEALEVDALYDSLAELGLTYGATFRALRAAYRRGDELFAELSLPEAARGDAARFALHPALLEGASQLLSCWAERAELALPAAWRGVRLFATGASELRIRVYRGSDDASFGVSLYDGSGELLGEVASLRSRPASAPALHARVEGADSLYRVAWLEAPALPVASAPWVLLGDDRALQAEASARYADVASLRAAIDLGTAAPSLVVLACRTAAEEGLAALHHTTKRLLTELQEWLSDERLTGTQLVALTQGAIAAGDDDELTDLTHAPLWGLLRTLQSEHPDRAFRLLDVDDLPASRAALSSALWSHEPQLALRAGKLLTPRITAAPATVASAARKCTLSGPGTVLITGGSGALAALLARHLVVRHGVANLLLCSRSGRADALQAELSALGASVTVAACDVSDRAALEALLAALPRERPLSAVFHTAGLTDDALFTAQDGESVERVFRPKVDGALHLHELTRDSELSAFVLFSSLAGVLGGAGQANYAAANAFLDALAQRRRSQGLPASSLSWGYWAERSALTAHVADIDRARMSRRGIEPIEAEYGLALLDAALDRPEAQLVPVRFNLSVLREADDLPPILRGLVRAQLRRVTPAAALQAKLARQSPSEQVSSLLQLTCEAAATVTGAPLGEIKANQPVQELGLDSLMALELRKRLALLTGLRLPATLLFDYPTPAKLARRLHTEIARGLPSAAAPVLAQLDRLESLLALVDGDAEAHAALSERLRAFASKWAGAKRSEAEEDIEENLYRANDEELYELIENSLNE